MDSILQNEKKCYFTGKLERLESHHVFRGPNRRNSERFGLKVWLHHDLHSPYCRGSVHQEPKGRLNKTLLRIGQMAFEEKYGTREEFIKIFGKNWLD